MHDMSGIAALEMAGPCDSGLDVDETLLKLYLCDRSLRWIERDLTWTSPPCLSQIVRMSRFSLCRDMLRLYSVHGQLCRDGLDVKSYCERTVSRSLFGLHERGDSLQLAACQRDRCLFSRAHCVRIDNVWTCNV